MKKILILIYLIVIFGNLKSQIMSATGFCTSSSGGASTTSVLQTSNANSEIAIGDFSGTMDLNPTAVSAPFVSNGNSDIFIQNYSNGVFQWGKRIGGIGMDKAVKVVGTYNEIYVTGVFSGTVDFNPNQGVFNLTSNGGTDVFILKLDANGNFIWAKSFGGNVNDDVRSMIYFSAYLNNDFNLYLTGTFQGTADLNPNENAFSNYTSSGMKDIFVVKMDASGNFIWAKKVGGLKNDISDDISSGGINNDLYIVGNFTQKADMDPSSSINNVETGIDKTAYFVLKLNLDGIFNFVKKIDNISNTGNFNSEIFKWSIVGSGDFILITGEFNLGLDFDPNAGIQNYISNTAYSSGFLLSLTNMGNFDWIRIFRPTATQIQINCIVRAPGEIYVTGQCIGMCDFDNTTTSQLSMVNNSSYFIFVLCYKMDGTFQWIRQFDNSGQGNSTSLSTYSHAGYNHLVIGGNLYPITNSLTADVFPGPDVVTIPVIQNGNISPFIVKWVINESYNNPIYNEEVTKSLSIINSETVKLFPNPTNRYVFIEDNNNSASHLIINQFGEKMNVPIVFKNNYWEIDLTELASGTYFTYNEFDEIPNMKKIILLK
jgi:hypothetical protein